MRNLLTTILVLITTTVSAQPGDITTPHERAVIKMRDLRNWATQDVLKLALIRAEEVSASVDQLGVPEVDNIALEAANDWAQALGSRVVLTTDPNEADIVIVAHNVNNNQKTLAYCEIRWVGDTYRRVAVIHFNTNVRFTYGGGGEGAFDLQTVMTHELGHAFGTTHSRHNNDLMYPSGGPNTVKLLKTNDTRRAVRNKALWLAGIRRRPGYEPDDYIYPTK